MDPTNPRPTVKRVRLAIVVSHPIQYFSPWFRHLAAQEDLKIKVFYLWDFGVSPRFDQDFGRVLQWDIPLLDGYDHEFLSNHSADPGTHHFRGLDNPGLVPALEAWRPEAILLFGYAYASHLRVILSRKLKNIPLLLRGDSHDLARPSGLKPWLKRQVRALLFRRFAGFLAVGKANADYYRNSGVPEERIHFAPHCVDNDRFRDAAPQAAEEARAWREELGIPAQALVVLFAGKLETRKRPMDLLEAFERMDATHPSPGSHEQVLLFAGSGEWEERLRARAGGRLGKTVFFAPFQNQSRMPMVYAAGDLLVLPSESESWGLAVNEAMNLARPAIVSTHVGCAEDLVLPGETGWIFEAGDVAALTGALSAAFAQGRGAIQAMGVAARRRVAGYSNATATEGLRATLASALLADGASTHGPSTP